MKHIKTALGRMARSRLILLAAGILCALLIIMGTTFAWLVSSDTRTNEIGIMQYQFDVALTEVFPAPTAVKGGTFPKEVDVKNTEDIPGFVRVMVFPVLVAADGTTLPEMRIGGQIRLGTLGASWTSGEDGYYYYLGRIAPGGTTLNPLFEEVTLDESVADGYPGAELTITLVVESIDGTDDYYRDAWWGGAAPAAPDPRATVDTALQLILA